MINSSFAYPKITMLQRKEWCAWIMHTIWYYTYHWICNASSTNLCFGYSWGRMLNIPYSSHTHLATSNVILYSFLLSQVFVPYFDASISYRFGKHLKRLWSSVFTPINCILKEINTENKSTLYQIFLIVHVCLALHNFISDSITILVKSWS